MIGFNPYVALGGVAALVAAAGGGFHFGQSYANGQNAKAQNQALQQAIAQRDEKQKLIDTLEAAAATREAQRQNVVREITREIPTIVRDPVYRNVCVSDDGVRALDRAAAAANGVDPGAPPSGPSPTPAVPAHH